MNKLMLQLTVLVFMLLIVLPAYSQNNSDYSTPDYSTYSYKHSSSTASRSSTSYAPLSRSTASRSYSGDVMVSPSRWQGSYYATSKTYTPGYKSHSSKY